MAEQIRRRLLARWLRRYPLKEDLVIGSLSEQISYRLPAACEVGQLSVFYRRFRV